MIQFAVHDGLERTSCWVHGVQDPARTHPQKTEKSENVLGVYVQRERVKTSETGYEKKERNPNQEKQNLGSRPCAESKMSYVSIVQMVLRDRR